MMTQTFLTIVSGVKKLVTAITATAGSGDAGKIPALDVSGKLDNSFLPTGIGAETKAVIASEALSAGDFVNIYNNAGTATARKADATTAGKEATGFVLNAVSPEATATVYVAGINTILTGLTAGARYVLSTTAGGVMVRASAPSSSGNVYQEIGVALSATEIAFEPGEPIVYL
jgi:hypothetical protein